MSVNIVRQGPKVIRQKKVAGGGQTQLSSACHVLGIESPAALFVYHIVLDRFRV